MFWSHLLWRWEGFSSHSWKGGRSVWFIALKYGQTRSFESADYNKCTWLWVILRKLGAGKRHLHTKTKFISKVTRTGPEDHFNSFRLLVPRWWSDIRVAFVMLRTFNDSATCKGIMTSIRVSTKLEELTLDEIHYKWWSRHVTLTWI